MIDAPFQGAFVAFLSTCRPSPPTKSWPTNAVPIAENELPVEFDPDDAICRHAESVALEKSDQHRTAAQ
jgi:hypothetical protein